KIIEECHHLIGVLRKFNGEAFDATQPMYYAVANVIGSMVYGSRFEYDDAQFTFMVDCTNTRLKLAASPLIQVYNIFPWLLKWLPDRKKFHRLDAVNRKQNVEMISRLEKTLDPQMCRGFVDSFLVQRQSLELSESGNNHFFDDENLLMTIQNLFGGGTDTTATTLRWGLLLMAKYPKIQDQVQEELSRVIGSRQVQVEDRKNLHFTNAVIHETQRLATIAPVALPHKTTRDVIFQGHFIKK
ncbi:cytochrome P450 2K4-like, partial [Plectropomus leopardus]|uniref:cytochrome P450 2K4-like n=1 Tax=Plectropomus leopardus TaxID=160734 RepID=UPI001C4A782D